MDWATAIATLIASFTGAWAAFLYQTRQKKQDIARENISAGNAALFTLFQQVNFLAHYQADRIDPHRSNPIRYIDIRATLPQPEDTLTFDFKSLDFLLARRDMQQLMMGLSIEGERYRETIKTINARSKHILEVIQPKIEMYGIAENTSDQVFRERLGERDYTTLISSTRALIMYVDRTVVTLAQVKERLRAVLLELYPKAAFINFERLANPPASMFAPQGSARQPPVLANRNQGMTSLREFYRSHYAAEFARRSDLNTALSLPVGIVSALLGALVVMAKELHVPFHVAELFEVTFIAAGTVACAYAVYLLFRSLWNYAYAYVPGSQELKNYKDDLVTYYVETGHPRAEAETLAEDETLSYVDEEYAKNASTNAWNNDVKSKFLYKANRAIIIAVMLAAPAGIAYVGASLLSAPQAQKVEVINLKDVPMVKESTPIQAATAPAPAPAPAPVKPAPPPSKLIKEDKNPPKPNR